MEIGPQVNSRRRAVQIDDAMERLVLEHHLNDWRDLATHLRLVLGNQIYPRHISLTTKQIGRLAASLVAESDPPTEAQINNAAEGYDAWTAVRQAAVNASLELISG